MQSYASSQKWNKKASIVTALVAIVGMASILYTANNFTNEQFVSAITSKNTFKPNIETNIYPWNSQDSETTDIVSQFTYAKNRIYEIDEKILENIRNGVSDASLFEQKGDLLARMGQYEGAIAHYEESLDIQYDQKVEDKLLESKATLDRVTRMHVN